MLESITKDISEDNKYKLWCLYLVQHMQYTIVVPSFGAAYAAPNNGTTILY